MDTLHLYDPVITEKFLKAGANPNARDNDNKDIISFAVHSSFPPHLMQAAIDHGFLVNGRDRCRRLPLDRILKFRNFENARVLVKAGAVSDRPWADVILILARYFPSTLPADAQDLKISPKFAINRLIIQIYRTSKRDKAILQKAAYRWLWRLKPSMTAFLTRIDEFDQMLV